MKNYIVSFSKKALLLGGVTLTMFAFATTTAN